ncbi:MAG TPA: PfkB family carbohydrate kinase [Chloroflexota bacterium]|nr:PfkB family carbohydrate kinase [Chloroflexota bacterium]
MSPLKAGSTESAAHRSYLVAGHVTRDILPDRTVFGGTALYAAAMAASLGYETRVLTSADTLEVFDFEQTPDVTVPTFHVIPSRLTTTFTYEWVEGRRIQCLTHQAGTIQGSDVPASWRDSSVWHLGPVAGEVEADIVDAIPDSAFVGVTPQGWLRSVGPDTVVSAGPWVSAERILARANAIIVSRDDLPDAQVSARDWARWGGVVVVTEAEHGATIHWSRNSVHLEAITVDAVDELGAGDVFAVAFFDRLSRGWRPDEAGRFAIAAGSLCVSRVGPFHPPSAAEIAATAFQAEPASPANWPRVRQRSGPF